MINGNEPVNPIDNGGFSIGITKREQFAMAAMQGNIKAFHDCDVTDFGEMASDCVLIADALLAELAKVKS